MALMKVYQVIHRQFDWGSRINQATLATYDDEKAQTHLEEAKIRILEKGLATQDHDWGPELGKGFSYGSSLGSMSFIPGAYSYVEQEVQ